MFLKCFKTKIISRKLNKKAVNFIFYFQWFIRALKEVGPCCVLEATLSAHRESVDSEPGGFAQPIKIRSVKLLSPRMMIRLSKLITSIPINNK